MKFPGTEITYRWALRTQQPWLFGSWRRFGIVTLLMLLVPTMLLAAYATLSSRSRLEQQTFGQIGLIASISSKQVSEEFSGLTHYVESFASRPTFVRAAARADLQALEGQLTAMVENNNKISRAGFTSTNGVLLSGYPKDERVEGRSFSDRDWFKGASSQSGAYVSEVYRREALGQEQVVSIASAVRDKTGARAGFLAAQYRIADIQTWMDRVLAETPLELLIVDQHGNPICDRIRLLEAIRTQRASISPAGASSGPPDGYRITFEGNDYLASKQILEDLNWSLYALMPTDVAFQSVREIRELMLVLFLFFLFIFLSIGLIWIKTLFRYAHSLERSKQHLEYFCYSIAHSFRAPLRAISGFADLLKEKGEYLDREGQEYITRLGRAGMEMDELVQDLLLFGNITHTDVLTEKLDVKAVIQEVIFQNKEELEKRKGKIALEGRGDGVFGDKKLLSLALKELLCNALKFVPSEKVPHIRFDTEVRGACVRIWVHDNGPGIEQKYHRQIFEMFMKLETDSPGTGVGLALARNAVERMGGSIGVQCAPGQGTSFWIDLPRG